MGLMPRAYADGPAYVVIISAKNDASDLDRKFLEDVFFKKITHWQDGDAIMPVDLRADAPARARFSEEVLGRSVMGVKGYWQHAIFSGQDVPPPELKSDREVIQYVVKNPGAIGYISGSSPDLTSESGVKTVNVR